MPDQQCQSTRQIIAAIINWLLMTVFQMNAGFFFLQLLRTCASSLEDRSKLFICPLTSHCGFLERPVCLHPSQYNVWSSLYHLYVQHDQTIQVSYRQSQQFWVLHCSFFLAHSTHVYPSDQDHFSSANVIYLHYSVSGSTFTAVGLFQMSAQGSGTLSQILSGIWQSDGLFQTIRPDNNILKTYMSAQYSCI